MLAEITPVILTFNEAPNIERTLDTLAWAKDIVVVDSDSDDDTRAIAAGFPNVRVFTRAFVSHADQWNFAITQTAVSTDWVLALDADYVLTTELIQELDGLKPDPSLDGYKTSFRYCVFGSPLRASLYPPVITLFRKRKGAYRQDGHTQRLVLEGPAALLAGQILHDDRKPLARWLVAQARYMDLEAEKLIATRGKGLRWADRIRKAIVFSPPLVFLYVLIVKRAIFDGRAGLYYAVQRTVAEMILSLQLLQRYLRRPNS